jgi:hypothetical protein
MQASTSQEARKDGQSSRAVVSSRSAIDAKETLLAQDAPQHTDPASHETVRHQMAQAMKANLVPGLIIWTIGLAIVLSYYFYPPVNRAFNVFGDFLQRPAGFCNMGIWFAIVATPIFAVLLPYLLQFLSSDPAGRQRAKALPFLLLFWAYRGTEIQILYTLQGKAWANLPRAAEIAISSFIDQFIFVPFWAVWTMVLAYFWKDHGYSLQRTREAMGGGFCQWYREKVWPIVVTNWFIWIPAVTLIYALPVPLRLPLMQLILCLFVLIITIIMRHKPESQAA